MTAPDRITDRTSDGILQPTPHAQAALVIVGTPIGNLGDLAPRAMAELAGADVIACEDTRRTRQLLAATGVRAGGRLLSVHEHNEEARISQILAHLDAGRRVVLVTDAGMPTVSDPGQRMVAAAAAAGHRVDVVPGPSAALAALAVSGLPTDRFCFEGFLPRKGRIRKERLTELRAESRTTVLFESPHRVRATVIDLADALGGERRVAVTRELTKRFEEVWRGTLDGARRHLDSREPQGEYALVIEGATPTLPEPASEADVESALRERLDGGDDKRAAITEVSARLHVARRQVYEVATRL